MWLELLASKDEALKFFKKIQVTAEVESGHRLKAFRTPTVVGSLTLELFRHTVLIVGSGATPQRPTPHNKMGSLNGAISPLLRWRGVCLKAWLCRENSGEKPFEQRCIC